MFVHFIASKSVDISPVLSHNTAKSRRLQDLVEMSYDVSVEGTEVRIMGILDLYAIPVLIYSTVKR